MVARLLLRPQRLARLLLLMVRLMGFLPHTVGLEEKTVNAVDAALYAVAYAATAYW